jgi:WD40 repeat protein
MKPARQRTATGGVVTRVDQRRVLEAFSRDYARELDNLLAADLQRFPTFVFQQLYNRVQWEVDAVETDDEAGAEGSQAGQLLAGLLEPAFARRSGAGAPVWLHALTRPCASETRVRVFVGHADDITACAFSPDGRRIVSTSADKTLKLWDAETGSCEATIKGHRRAVTACAFSPDGRRIVSGSADKTLRLWDARTGVRRATLEGHKGEITACAFSPDGRTIVSASRDKTLKLWDATTGACEATLAGHRDGVNACAFSPDGRRIVSGSADKTLKLWDATTGACQATLEGNSRDVNACAFSPDGRRIVSGAGSTEGLFWRADDPLMLKGMETGNLGDPPPWWGIDDTLKLWDAETGACEATLEGHDKWVNACAFSPDGETIVSASGYGLSAGHNTLKLWDAETGACRATVEGHTGPVNACAFSPDGATIVSGSADKTLKLWGARTGVCRATLIGWGWIDARAFSTNGQTAASGSSGKMRRVPTPCPDPVQHWPGTPGDRGRTVSDLDFGFVQEWEEEQKRDALLEKQGRWVYARDNSPDVERATLERHAGDVTACAFSPDGRKVVTGSWDDTLKLWDAETGRCEATLEGCGGGVWACAFSPDGQSFVSACGDHTLKLRDAETGSCKAILEGHRAPVRACAFSSGGDTMVDIVSGSDDKTLKFWNAGWSTESHALPDDRLWRYAPPPGHTGGITACAFSPDGARVVSASWDKTLKLWDVGTRTCTATFGGHRDAIYACAYSPDGRRIVSAGGDKTLKLWDVRTERCVATLEGHTGEVYACAFSADGEMIVSAGWDGSLKFWDAGSGAEILSYTAAGGLNTCAFSPLGDRVCCGGAGGTVYILELAGDLTAARSGARKPEPVVGAFGEQARGGMGEAPTPASSPRDHEAAADTNPQQAADSPEVRPAPRAPAANVRRPGLTAVLLCIAASACGVGGYLLTTLSGWLWLIAVPLFLIALLLLVSALFARSVTCPHCFRRTTVIFARTGDRTCTSCQRKLTWSRS